jgi:hypothetical protein
MPAWMFFCFLWDDPLFNSEAHEDRQLFEGDPEFAALRRRLRLAALELLYLELKTAKEQLLAERQTREQACAREVWTIQRFLEHLPADSAERVLIDRKVNDMDPDWDWCTAIGIEPQWRK